MRNPLSIVAFADWAEKQPADKEYDYDDNFGCAFCRYLSFLGKRASVGSETWYDRNDPELRSRRLPAGVNDAVIAEPHTFGALVARLRAIPTK